VFIPSGLLKTTRLIRASQVPPLEPHTI